jgi:hypothetical protein
MNAHVIIAGQSNALGFGNTGPAPYTPTYRVQIWTDTDGDGQGDAWNCMNPGVNTGTPANPKVWGPEVGEANRFLAARTGAYDILWVVKVARGSTGLAQDPAQPDWSPASTGEMYATATATINAARHNLDGGPYAFTAWDRLDWMQGETDAQSAAKAAAYGVNVRDFITHARTDWSVEDVVVARITDSTALPYSLDVRQAEWNLDNGDAPMADVHTFKTIGFGMQADGLHYDAAGQLALGQGFFDAWGF